MIKNWQEWREAEVLRLAANRKDAESSDEIILRLSRRVAELTAQIEWLEGNPPTYVDE